jgi:hypothetical protein
MTTEPPDLRLLRLSYERYLLAKVQMIELQAWGESTVGLLRHTVTDHEELERAYIQAMVERRRKHAEPKKAGPLHRERP